MIKLRPEIVEKCREHGVTVVGGYARGDHPESRALSIRGVEKDPIVQAEGKMAECIFAVECGLDPLFAVNWTGRPELNGIDVVINGVGVDVKQTRPGGRLIIWSAGKTGKLESKEFDVFVLVTCQLADLGGETKGWVTRRYFMANHKVAPPPTWLLPGTMYLDGVFRSMTDFPASRRHLFGKPDAVAQSTWDAFAWLRKFNPERLGDWLLKHPEIPQ